MRSSTSLRPAASAVLTAIAAGATVTPVLLGVILGVSASALMLAVVPPALAIDPGQVKGTVRIGNEQIKLTHAYAHFHDNAEGILSRAKEVRILLADGEADQAELAGMVFLPVEERAKEGKIRGILLVLDPANPNEVNVTWLYPPEEEGYSLMNQSLSTSGKDLWTKFAFSAQRVGGTLEEGDVTAQDDPDAMFPSRAFTFEFSAPVFNEPAVTLDVKGKEAKESPQAKVLRDRVAAMTAGDVEALQGSCTVRANAKMQGYMKASGMSREDVVGMLKQFGPEQATMLEKIDRLVVRGDRAVIIYVKDDTGTQWATFAMEDGVWKSED